MCPVLACTSRAKSNTRNQEPDAKKGQEDGEVRRYIRRNTICTLLKVCLKGRASLLGTCGMVIPVCCMLYWLMKGLQAPWQLSWESLCGKINVHVGKTGLLSISQQCNFVAEKGKSLLAAWGRQLPAGWGKWSLPSTQHWCGCIWSAMSSSELPRAGKIGTYWNNSSIRPWRWWRDWSIFHVRTGWESRDCSAGRDRGKYMMGGNENDGVFPLCPLRQEALRQQA